MYPSINLWCHSSDLLKPNFYWEKRNLMVFRLKLLTGSWAGQGGRHRGQGNVAEEMLWEEFTPYRLLLGAQHFLHDSINGTCDGQILPIAEFNKTHSVMPWRLVVLEGVGEIKEWEPVCFISCSGWRKIYKDRDRFKVLHFSTAVHFIIWSNLSALAPFSSDKGEGPQLESFPLDSIHT